MKKFYILAIVLAVMISGCGERETVTVSQSCAEEDPEFAERLQDYLEQWIDAVIIVESSTRGTMLDPISDLQTLRREVRGLEGPQCGETAQDALVNYMDFHIELFLDFARGDLPDPSNSGNAQAIPNPELPNPRKVLTDRLTEIAEAEEIAVKEIDKLFEE